LQNIHFRVARDLREDGWLEVMYDKKKTTYARLENIYIFEDY